MDAGNINVSARVNSSNKADVNNLSGVQQDNGDFTQLIMQLIPQMVNGSGSGVSEAVEGENIAENPCNQCENILQLAEQLTENQIDYDELLSFLSDDEISLLFGLAGLKEKSAAAESEENQSDSEKTVGDINTAQPILAAEQFLIKPIETDAVPEQLTEMVSEEEIKPVITGEKAQVENAVTDTQTENKDAESFEIDFENLDKEELSQLLKSAVENGVASIKKDTNLGDIIGKMSEKYRISAAAEKVRSGIQTESSAEAVKEEKISPKNDSSDENASYGLIDYNVQSNHVAQVKVNGTTEENAVFNQTLDSISHFMKEGKESYTARLNPEGLGKIVVKMVKEEGNLVISIVATNEKTAAIINSNLNSLQANLGENTQINKAQVAQPQFAYHGFDLNGQGNYSNAQEQRQFYNESYAQHYYNSMADENDEADETAVSFHEGKINTYV